MPRGWRRLAFACGLLVFAAAPTPAGAASKTYSTGAIRQAIADGGSTDRVLSVPDKGPVSHVTVSVRIDHLQDGQLTLELVSPSGRTVLLSGKRGGSGRNYGTGPGCDGQLTVFDDEFGTPIGGGVAPFVDNPYIPEQRLSSLNGEEAAGRWTIRIADDAPGASGFLRCVKLDLSRNVVQRRVARRGRVSAELTYRETNYRYFGAHIAIRRGGQRALSASLAQVNCPGCPNTGLLFTSESRTISVRDLDSDGEPEVLLDLYSGGAHCCSYTLIFRYRPSFHDYRRLVGYWGNAGYRVTDLDGDGRPELASADDRFAYVFAAYAFSAFPPRIWHYDHGRLVDITRRFPALVEQDARLLWRDYLRVRGEDYPEIRGILAAFMAEEYLLGREDEGWRRLEAILHRGELGPAKLDRLWPVGPAYMRKLRAFLHETGYAT